MPCGNVRLGDEALFADFTRAGAGRWSLMGT